MRHVAHVPNNVEAYIWCPDESKFNQCLVPTFPVSFLRDYASRSDLLFDERPYTTYKHLNVFIIWLRSQSDLTYLQSVLRKDTPCGSFRPVHLSELRTPSCSLSDDDRRMLETVLHPYQYICEEEIQVWYHGTTAKNAHSIMAHGFRPSQCTLMCDPKKCKCTMLGRGVYLGHYDKASDFCFHDVNNVPRSEPGLVIRCMTRMKRVGVFRGKCACCGRMGADHHGTWQSSYDSLVVPAKAMSETSRPEVCVADVRNIYATGLVPPLST
jgi:hypothetical protein